MPPTRLGDDRTWQWGDRVVHLLGGDHPRIVYAALLAFRDAATPEDGDVADVLVWTVEEHPPWSGGCPICGTEGVCDMQRTADGLALEYLIRASTDRVRRVRERLANRKDVA